VKSNDKETDITWNQEVSGNSCPKEAKASVQQFTYL